MLVGLKGHVGTVVRGQILDLTMARMLIPALPMTLDEQLHLSVKGQIVTAFSFACHTIYIPDKTGLGSGFGLWDYILTTRPDFTSPLCILLAV